MTPNERGPALITAAASRPLGFQVFPDCARRDLYAEFQLQFVGDPLLTPRRILASHHPNEFAQVVRERRSSSLPGFPFPKQPKCGPMPFHEGLRLHNYQGIAPGEESAEQDEPRASRSVRALGPYVSFLKQSKLPTKEQIFGDQGRMRPKKEAESCTQIWILHRRSRPCGSERTELLRSTRAVAETSTHFSFTS